MKTLRLPLLVRQEGGFLSRETIDIGVDSAGVIMPSGTTLTLERSQGSILGWGEFDQAGEHWTLGGAVIRPADADKILAITAR